MLRLLSRRRCLSCGEELPPPREYAMRVCATCILDPARARPSVGAAGQMTAAPAEADWRDERDHCA